MREIKFRVWDKHSKEMSVGTIGPKDWGDYLIEFKNGAVDVAAEYCEWLQYTGLKDGNDVEIYEGDIVSYSYVKNHPTICKIVYEPRAAAFLLYDMSKGSINYVQMKYLGDIVRDNKGAGTRTYELCEVIGNIYQNPELLEKII